MQLDLDTVAFMLYLQTWTHDDEISDFPDILLKDLYDKWIEGWLPHRNKPHFGDCTKQPISCLRCNVEEIYEEANRIVLSPYIKKD